MRGPTLLSRFAFSRANPVLGLLPDIEAVFDTEVWGLGCSITNLSVTRLGLRFRLLLLATQCTSRELAFTIGVSAPSPVPSQLTRLLLRPIVHDVLQDREIWAHKIDLERPALTREDAPLVSFRRYAQQFYPPPGTSGAVTP